MDQLPSYRYCYDEEHYAAGSEGHVVSPASITTTQHPRAANARRRSSLDCDALSSLGMIDSEFHTLNAERESGILLIIAIYAKSYKPSTCLSACQLYTTKTNNFRSHIKRTPSTVLITPRQPAERPTSYPKPFPLSCLPSFLKYHPNLLLSTPQDGS
jgi:hypothetical protein